MTNQNIVLIGMPGAGKSTIGVLLAKETAFDFVDTDVLIQVRQGKMLQQILDESGYLSLRQIEQQVLLELELSRHIVATGGSAVYSDAGMANLMRQGLVVFLDVSLEQLQQRIHNYDSRGIARRPDQSFQDLFGERQLLYRRYAQCTINCDHKSPERIVQQIVQQIVGKIQVR
jgi:shikimate kinase